MHTKICGKQVSVTFLGIEDAIGYHALSSRIFREWAESLDPRFAVSRVAIQNVEFRGAPSEDTVMFIRLSVMAVNAPFEQIVELRGGTVIMLVILSWEGVDFTVLVQQPRIATGNYSLPEVPAGMIDGGTFISAAAREIEEELGLKFEEQEFEELTDGEGIYLSPGLLDEQARVYLVKRNITRKRLDRLQGKATGVAEEGEQITLKVISLDSLVEETRDAKALVALALYRQRY